MEADEFLDLQKFLITLASKTASLITGARSESPRVHSIPCNPNPASADWFGLAVQDQPKIRAEVKELSKNSRIVIDQPFTVEIIAQLPTSEEIPLEFWWLWWTDKDVDKDVRVKSVVYNRMAILLKSVVVVLRASPINRMIRQNDYFKYTHKIFSGRPDLSLLKSVGKHFQIGPLKTPYGSVYFAGACREAAFSENPISHPLTEPVLRAFQPQSPPIKIQLGRSSEKLTSPLSLSPSEKFRLNCGPPDSKPRFCNVTRNPEVPVSFANLHCVGAFADPTKSSSDSEDDSYEIPDSAFSKLIPPLDDDDKETLNLIEPVIQPKPILKDFASNPKTEIESPKSFKAMINSDVELISDDGFDDGEDFLDPDQLDCQLAPHQLQSLEKKNEKVANTVRSLSENLVGMEALLLEFDQFVDDLRQVGGESSWIMTVSGH